MSKSLLSKKSFAVLSREEERDLLVLAKKGDQIAKEKIINQNIGFVVELAKKYIRNGGLEMDDLLQVGKIALLRAIDAYKIDSGNKFISCARWWIMDEMRDAVLESRSIIIPKNKWMQIVKKSYVAEDDADLLDAKNALKISSIYIANGDDDFNLTDFIEGKGCSPELDFFTNENKRLISNMFNILTEREEYVLKSYLGYGCEKMSLAKIGQGLNVSKAMASQIKDKAVNKIRNSFVLDDFEWVA